MLKVLFKDAAIYGLSTAIAQFASLLLVPVYTKIFSPSDYGAVDVISTTVGLVAITCMLQLESAVNRHYYAEKNPAQRKVMLSTALWTVLLVSLFFSAIAASASSIISQAILHDSAFAVSFSVAFATVPLVNLNGLFSVIIRYRKEPVRFLSLQLIQVVSVIALSFCFVVLLKWGIKGVFWGQVLGLTIGVLSKGLYLGKEFSLQWDKERLRDMLRYSLPLVPAVLGSWGNTYVNRFIMVSYLPLSQIGLYSLAVKVVSVFQLIGTALKMAWQPLFWEAYESNPNHASLFKSVQEKVTLAMLLLVTGITVFGPEILMAFTSKAYYGAGNLIGFLALSLSMSYVISPFTVIGPGIKKRTEYNTVIFMSGLLTNIGCLLITVPFGGVTAVAISLLVSSLTSLAVGWYYSEKLYPVKYNKTSFIVAFLFTTSVIIINFFFKFSLGVKLAIAASIVCAIGAIILRSRYFLERNKVPNP